MVYYKDREWHISKEKVKYTDNGKEKIRDIGVEGRVWWTNFEEMWDDITIIEFIPIDPSDLEMARLEKINKLNIPDGFGSIINDYIFKGIFPKEIDHKLRNLQMDELSQHQGISISQREINEIILGVQVSDLEIEILMMKGGM